MKKIIKKKATLGKGKTSNLPKPFPNFPTSKNIKPRGAKARMVKTKNSQGW